MPRTITPTRLRAALSARRRRIEAERELDEFASRYGAVLRPRPPVTGGTALIASLTHSPFQLKLEGMLAKALQLEGADVVAAVPAGSELPRRTLELFGIDRFVSVDDFAGPKVEERARGEAAELLAACADTGALKALSYRGADVGRQVLSTISRHLHEGAVDLARPEIRALAAEFLPASLRTTLAAEALLEALDPETVLFCERNYTSEGPLCDLALVQGRNVIQFVSGFEDDTLVFKRYTAETKGLHPRSVSDESWALVERLDWTAEHDRELEDDFGRRYDGSTFLARWNQGWTRRAPREEIAAELGLDLARRTAVVFSHVLWDANMFFGRDLFADQEEWFVETVRAACANDRVNWIVKLHPANVWKLRRDGVEGELDEVRAIREHVGELPPHVRLLRPQSEISTWSLFALTDVGVTIRGSVGFELPCLGIPVLTAGTGFYSGRGFTVDSADAGEYLERLRAIEDVAPPTPEQVELARKHAYALFRLRQTRFSTFRSVYAPLEEVAGPAEATIEVTPRSAEELWLADDLRQFGRWAVGSRDLDWLSREVVGVESR